MPDDTTNSAKLDSLLSQESEQTDVLKQILETLKESSSASTSAQEGTEKKDAEGKKQGKKDRAKGKKDFGFIAGMLDKLSVALPGGARLFGLGGFVRSIQNAKTPLAALGAGFTGMTAALFGATEGLRALGRSLGGVTGREALGESLGALGQTIAGLGEGRLRMPTRTIQMQGAFGQEFGGLLTSEAAARMGDVVTDTGIAVGELVKLERALQGTGVNAEGAINAFKSVGILGRIAAQEMAKNAGAIARAGGAFTEFIVAGIKNAKQLGLEFGKIEKTLTGFTTDFSGTITSFAELRAVIPGFGVDMGQMLSTAMTGTTDEYIALIRQGLTGAGITSVAGMSRQALAALEGATGFSTEQINRILKNENVNQEVKESLDTDRNSLLNMQVLLLGGLLGAVVAIAPWGIVGSAAGLAIAGGMTGVGVGAAMSAFGPAAKGSAPLFNDVSFAPDGSPMRLHPDDVVLKEGRLGKSATRDDINRLILAVNRIGNSMQNASIEISSLDKAILRMPIAAAHDQLVAV